MGEVNRQKRIIVIDDDDKIVRFISLKLKIAGYEVFTADNGYDGLTLIEQLNPNALVLDLLMPVMDGFEVMKRLRKASQLPILVMTARADAFAEARKLGANEFLPKPFDPGELVRKVDALLGLPS